MASNSHLLVNTLVQRGESDNYIQSRLEALGIPNQEAQRLIDTARHHTEVSSSRPITSTEVFSLLIELVLLLAVIFWLMNWLW